jgi:ribosomal-protein-alanine N-acetyltransferase
MLRLPRYSDYPQWYRLRSDSRAFLQPWEPVWNSDELSQSAFRARVVRNEQEYESGQAVPLLIFDAAAETLLGGITVGYIRRGAAQACMVGYWIGERFARQGHMSAALHLTVHHIFHELSLHRIEAACIPHNHKSLTLLEKAGFEREGILKDYLKINGVWQDHVMLSLIKDDGKSKRMTGSQ